MVFQKTPVYHWVKKGHRLVLEHQVELPDELDEFVQLWDDCRYLMVHKRIGPREALMLVTEHILSPSQASDSEDPWGLGG